MQHLDKIGKKMADEKKLKEFWNGCKTPFAHIDIKEHLKNKKKLTDNWKRCFLDKLIFKNKMVLDYGTGGGYLGELLFDSYHIAGYCGVDISSRSLEKATKVLNGYNNVWLVDTDTYYNNFLSIGKETGQIDIFVCQAVIQHFPDEEYLQKFLTKLREINPSEIMLQIAYNDETKFISNNGYTTEKEVVRACYTNCTYINEVLKYNIHYVSEIHDNNYQFLILKR